MKKVMFGIGCFHFWLVKKTPFVFKSEEYKKELELALKDIRTISNLEINLSDDDDNIAITEPFESLGDGECHFPGCNAYLQIKFDLTIPFQLQKELMLVKGMPKKFTKHFRVDMRYGFSGPVSFVELSKSNSSVIYCAEAVVVVRNYLDKMINRNLKTIRFDFLGPSPFHADCCLLPSSSRIRGGEKFKLRRITSRAFDTLLFEYNRAAFKTIDDAKDELFMTITDELNLFYGCNLSQAQTMREWRNIEKYLTQLIESRESKNIVKCIKSRIKRGRLIGDIQAAMTKMESNRIIRNHQFMASYRDTYVKDEYAFFKSYVDEEQQEAYPYPVEQVRNLIQFLENRWSRSIEMIVVILAAIIGGAVGSILTILISSK